MSNSVEVFSPRSPHFPKPVKDQVEIEAPLKQEESPRKPFIQLALMVGIPVLMVIMMILMFTVGGRNNPMMMMMVGVMMLSMCAGMVMQLTGGNQASVNSDRQNYVLMLGKNRRKAHAVGRSQHAIQTHFYPNPNNLPNLVRVKDPSMWSARPSETAAPTNNTLELGDETTWDESEQSGNPYMKARVGNGLIELSPPIRVRQDESVAPEQLEPVTYQASVNFLATQNVVPNSPVAVSIDSMPAIGLRGHVPYRYDLVRGMVMSLTFNHSPDRLMVGVVSTDDEWDWIKWLPHNANTFIEPDEAGYRTLRWSTFTESVRDLKQSENVLVQDQTRVLVIVDLPTTSLRYPPGVTQVNNVTFLVVRAQDDEAVTKKRSNRFHISNEYSSDRMFSAWDQIEAAKVDAVPRYLAENYARLMAPLRTPNFGPREVVSSSDDQVQVLDAPRMLESLGIGDLDRYDLQRHWRETDQTETLTIPLGFAVERDPRSKEYRPTGNLVHLDMLQVASGGTGPHGLFSGGTGTGKSFLMEALVLQLCALYSPRKLNIIAADFKGGSTFSPMEHLPHFQANLSNLGGALDMVDRAYDVLEGEKRRRYELFDHYGVKDIFDYRKRQASDPSMPDIPDLLFIADEFREFITENRDYKKLFDSIAGVGRSLGMHLLLASQFIDQTMVGESVTANKDFGISLKVGDAAKSNFVVGVPDAAMLPSVRVGILQRKDLQDTIHEYFQGFDHSLPYVRRSVHEPGKVTAGAERQVIDATLTEFSLAGFAEHADTGTVEEDITLEQSDAAVDTGKNEYRALLDMVAEKSRDYADTYTMWTKPMGTPMTLAGMEDEDFAVPDSRDIVIRMGDVDMPYEHKRVPMNLTLSPSTGNVAVIGEPGTGRTTTIKTMIASSALRYTGRHLSWMVFDYAGTSLAAMESYPNVSAYATRGDLDTWNRIKGEIDRVLAIRQRVFDERRITDMYEYLNLRAEIGVAGDPHGHIGLAIDGLQEWADSIKHDETIKEQLKHWLEVGPRHGVYLVGTGQDGSKMVLHSMVDRFTTGIRHFVTSRMKSYNPPSGGDNTFTKVLTRIPANDPGRVIDGSQTDDLGHTMYLHGRVLLPVQQEITPVSYTNGVPRYEVRKDFSPEITELGRVITASGIGRFAATKLETVGTHVTLKTVMGAMNPALRDIAQKDRPIPYGVDTATNLAAALDPSKTPTFSDGMMRHLAVCGDARSGRTTTLRTLMAATAQMYSPEEARFIVLDGTGSLSEDVRGYIDQGYMRPTSYAMDKDQARVLMEKLRALIADRAPDPEQLRRDTSVKDARSYFEGPEMFVFIDNSEQFLARGSFDTSSGAGFENMVASLPPYDVGVRTAFTLGTNVPTYISGNKGVQRLFEELGLYLLLHSGRNVGAITMGTQTRFRRLPPGRAQLFHPTDHSSSDVPVVQVATPD